MPAHCGLLVAGWSEEDVEQWLCEEGLQELVSVFRANNMDGAELILLNKETAAELGIGEGGTKSRTSVQSTQTHTHAGTWRGLRICRSIPKHDRLELNSTI